MSFQVKDGSFTYPGHERQILSGINFSLQPGDVLTILGPNGAGKTTLLRCIMGLLAWDSGESLLDGTSLKDIPQKTLWQHISYVPQAKQAPANYSVEEMILLGRAATIGVFSTPGEADRRAVDRVLERTKLEPVRHRLCSQLSGGEFQMVLIARALVSDPQVLILDEPESNLDFQNQLLVLDLIAQLASEGITCIFNTHYPAHALRHANKALMLAKDGRHCFGEVRQVVTEENILRYFGVRSVIGAMETADQTYADVIPVAIDERLPGTQAKPERVIAGITVLMEGDASAGAMNHLLRDYNQYMIGRMGLPYRKAGVNIITLTLDAPVERVLCLTDGLSRLPGAHVKTTYIAGGETIDQSGTHPNP